MPPTHCLRLALGTASQWPDPVARWQPDGLRSSFAATTASIQFPTKRTRGAVHMMGLAGLVA